MKIQSFRTNTLLRIVALVGFAYGAIFLWVFTPYWLLGSWLLLFHLIAIFDLIRYVRRSEIQLAQFLIGVKQKDFSSTSGSTAAKIRPELNSAFETISTEFKKVRELKENEHHYLQTIVEHTSLGLICYNEDTGKVEIINEAAKDLLSKQILFKIDGLATVSSELHEAVTSLKSNDTVTLKIMVNNYVHQLLLKAEKFRILDVPMKLVSIQDIRNALEEQELDSWQKLIRVLTHEMRNSAIPISTLAEVLIHNFETENGKAVNLGELPKETQEEVKQGLQTIARRSKGLVKFVKEYEKLNRLPQPTMAPFSIQELFQKIGILLEPGLKKDKVKLLIDKVKDQLIIGDIEMIEHVIINLISNARASVADAENPRIHLGCNTNSSLPEIFVDDNGPGVDPAVLDNIFIPFFTTRKDGSGIGLSLSRQIMRLHGGRISVGKTTLGGASFRLEF